MKRQKETKEGSGIIIMPHSPNKKTVFRYYIAPWPHMGPQPLFLAKAAASRRPPMAAKATNKSAKFPT